MIVTFELLVVEETLPLDCESVALLAYSHFAADDTAGYAIRSLSPAFQFKGLSYRSIYILFSTSRKDTRGKVSSS